PPGRRFPRGLDRAPVAPRARTGEFDRAGIRRPREGSRSLAREVFPVSNNGDRRPAAGQSGSAWLATLVVARRWVVRVVGTTGARRRLRRGHPGTPFGSCV